MGQLLSPWVPGCWNKHLPSISFLKHFSLNYSAGEAEKDFPPALLLPDSSQHLKSLWRLPAPNILFSSRWIKYQAEDDVWLWQQPNPAKYLLQSRKKDSMSSWEKQEMVSKRVKEGDGEGDGCVRHDVSIRTVLNDISSS